MRSKRIADVINHKAIQRTVKTANKDDARALSSTMEFLDTYHVFLRFNYLNFISPYKTHDTPGHVRHQ